MKDHANSKTEFSQLLEELAELLEVSQENPFRIRALKKAALQFQQDDVIQGDKLEEIASGKLKISGVGEGVKAYLKEFLKTGALSDIETTKAKIPEGVFLLMKLPGLGAKKAFQLVTELGVQDLSELEYACRENRLVELKGFGPATQIRLLEAIERFNTQKGKFLLPDALELAEKVMAALKRTKANALKDAKTEFVGGLARKAEIVEALEILICVGDLDTLDLKKSGLKILSQIELKKFNKDLLRLEVEFPEIMAELKITFWITSHPSSKLRAWLCASEKLRQLPEAHETWSTELMPTHLEPEWCLDTDRALKNQGKMGSFYLKVKSGGMRGVFHNHTTSSDGSASLEEMVRAAQTLGYEYIGISDHSQTAIYAHGLEAERLAKQRQDIKALQKKVKIRIFHGVESDILQDGSLDYPDQILKDLDFVVASIHSRFKMDETAMNERLETALKNPYATFWGHPTGRLLLGRVGYPVKWRHLLTIMKKNQMAIELNANPQRLDFDWRLGALVEESGVFVGIHPDAHSTDGLQDTQWGEWMLEKAMIPAKQVLNLKSADEMEEYLNARRKSLF